MQRDGTHGMLNPLGKRLTLILGTENIQETREVIKGIATIPEKTIPDFQIRAPNQIIRQEAS